MNHMIAGVVLCCFLLTVKVAVAETTATEPGQAESPTTSSPTAGLPAVWDRPAVEARSIWITGQELLQPREKLLKLLDDIAAANFNGILLDTWFRGFVTYPGSVYVPQHPDASKAGLDVLAWIIDEAHRRGLRADAWTSYGYYAYHTPDIRTDSSRGPLLTKHPELAALDSNGLPYLRNPTLGYYYSLCPANQRSHDLLAAIFTETLQRYPFDGLNLDRMRFPASSFCFCPHCKTQYKADTGEDLTTASLATTDTKFLQWKRKQNAAGVATVARAVRLLRPGTPITSYVVPPAEMNDKAQSWDLWVSQGSVDAVAVSMYGRDIRENCRKALELLNGRNDKLICAISCDLATSSLYLQNIQYARNAKTLGQFTWYTGKVKDDVEELRSGPYAAKATFPVLE